jgi:hypothetical protein
MRTDRGIAVAGQKAYLTPGGALQVVDFTKPEQLITTGVLPANISDVAVAGDYAYIVSAEQGLWVVDIGGQTMPVVARYTPDIFRAQRIAVNNGYAYVINNETELRIINIANVPVFAEAGSYAKYPYRFNDIAVVDGYGYLSTTNTGELLILDLADPLNPTEVALLNKNDNDYFGEVAANNGYLFSIYYKRLTVFDLSQPASPVAVGTYELPSDYYRLAVEGESIYLINRHRMDVFKFTPGLVNPLE